MQLSEVRKELQFNTELLILVDTLKNIAGAQYQLMEREKKKRFDRFMQSFSGFFRVVHLTDVEDPLVRPAGDVLGIVLVTSDAGFMGGLNGSVIETALARQIDLPPDKVRFIVVGEKGANAFRDVGRPYHFFPGVTNETRYERAVDVREYIVREVLERRIGRVIVVYPKPLSFTRQVLEVTNLLPAADLFEPTESHETTEEPGVLGGRRVIVESSFSDMMHYLVSVWVTSKLFEIFEDSKLSEFAARAMHLEGSVQKLQQDNKKLKYRFFRAAHEQVDKGMRESFSSKKLRDAEKKAEKR